MNRGRVIVVILLCGVAIGAGGRFLVGAFGGGTAVARTRLFDQVLGHVERNYVDSIDAGELYRRAANGMVLELHDPPSMILDAKRSREDQASTTGFRDGIGVQVDASESWVNIIAVLAGSPADKAGLRAGDRILEIDGTPAFSRAGRERRQISGAPGTQVTLLIERPGAPAHFSVTVTRATFHVSPIRHAFLLAPGVGYIQLATFSDSASSELLSALDALKKEGARQYVLDLRGDPGGLLLEATHVASAFLPSGKTIVTLRGREHDSVHTLVDDLDVPWTDVPLVVLVDGYSASASEIVAGAWQDHDRAAVVGSTTYGKGSAQSTFALAGDAGELRLTTELWYTPSGRSIQRRHTTSRDDGGTPRDTLSEIPLAQRKQFRTDAGRVVYGGGGITPDLIVTPQDSVDGLIALERALGKDGVRFRDAIVEVAAAARAGGAVRGTAITVTPRDRELVWQRAQTMGIKLSRAAFDSSATAVDRVIGYEIARVAFSSDDAWKYRLGTDRVAQAALSLMQGASTQREVLDRAAGLRAAHREDVPRSK
jgi:carboxyl-terminal processing protease